jgi:hypothetical protein
MVCYFLKEARSKRLEARAERQEARDLSAGRQVRIDAAGYEALLLA